MKTYKPSKIRQSYFSIEGGYIKWKNDFEINWSFYRWALPLNIEVYESIIFVSLLCVTFSFRNIFTRHENDD